MKLSTACHSLASRVVGRQPGWHPPYLTLCPPSSFISMSGKQLTGKMRPMYGNVPRFPAGLHTFHVVISYHKTGAMEEEIPPCFIHPTHHMTLTPSHHEPVHPFAFICFTRVCMYRPTVCAVHCKKYIYFMVQSG